MRQSLLEQLERNELIGHGARLLVAVSGGIDSVVLLHLLRQLASSLPLDLFAAHLDHAIRQQSSDDARFVGELCREWDVPLTVERCDVPSLASSKKISMEMAAREARYEFLRRVAEEKRAEFIVLAHHRDDQAETFLLRLLRGSGLSGLGGMRGSHERLLRPLLDISREQIEAYANEHGLEWVEDKSNQDSRYLRNRVRHQLLPQMKEYNPRLDERLAHLCRQQQVEEDFWRLQMEEALPSLILSRQDDLRLCRGGLLALHPALRVRVMREAIRLVRGDLQRLEEKHLAAFMNMLEGEQSQAELDLPGLWAARRYNQLWLRGARPEIEVYSYELPVPGEVHLPDGRRLMAELQDGPCGESDNCVEFAADQLSFPLMVRTFVEGDRLSLSGSGGSKKLKDFFIDIKLESEQRRQVPLVLSGEKILWVAGVRRSSHAPGQKSTGQVLRLELENP